MKKEEKKSEDYGVLDENEFNQFEELNDKSNETGKKSGDNSITKNNLDDKVKNNLKKYELQF